MARRSHHTCSGLSQLNLAGDVADLSYYLVCSTKRTFNMELMEFLSTALTGICASKYENGYYESDLELKVRMS
jgi:hypothetical protein